MVEYSGRTSSYNHKHDSFNKENKPWSEIPHGASPALKQVWFFDAQWTDCPVEVENEIKALWRIYELGNDNFILKRSINDLRVMLSEGCTMEVWENSKWKTKPLVLDYLLDYLSSKNIPDDEQIIFHWWW